MVAGYTKRDSQGRDAWVYRNGVTTQIGLPLQPSGVHHSTIVALNQADMVAGYTTHQAGEDAWLYDGSTTIRLGLTGAEYISSAGVESSRVHALNDSGNASGTTVRYNSGTKVLGTAAWFYDGSQTIRIGLTDAAHTRDDGYQASLTSRMSKQGNYVAGGSYRYSGNVQIGEDAWLYDGISTVQIGLAGGDLTDASGFQRNVITDINEHGQAIGNSVVVAPVSAIGRSAAWFYDGNETRRLGLTDAMHTGRDGARDSTATLLNEQGQVAGISERFNGRYIPFANDENDSSPWLGMSAWLYDSSLDQIFDLTLSVRQGDKYAYSQVFYLGEDGMVLGEYELFDSNDASLGYRAFYFSTADGLWDLGLLVPGLDVEGWSHLASALKANGLGHIVGTGAIEGKNGQAAYLLTPNAVPLPASAWLLGSALFGLGLTARRSRCAS